MHFFRRAALDSYQVRTVIVRQLSEPRLRLGKLIAVPSLPPHYLA